MKEQDPALRRRGTFRPVNPYESLHSQAGAFQLKYVERHAEALLEGLDDVIAAMASQAPIRTRQPYVLVRRAGASATYEEARWVMRDLARVA
jgi:hypothetical protein